MTLSEKLKKLRKDKKLTQAQLATIIGVERSSIGKYETGTTPSMDVLAIFAEYFNVTVDYLLGLSDDNTSPLASSGAWVPVLGQVQAGIPIEAVQNVLDYEDISNISKDPSEYFALQVKGQSMEPKFSEGDVVIVKKQDTAEDGEIVIALVNGDEATIKKLKKRADGIVLLPLNQQFDMMYYTAADIESLPVRILGKVVELRAKF